jgi:hypothetical protein
MARAKSSTTTTTDRTRTGTAVDAGRVRTLEPRDGRMLSSLEEAVVRMHHGVGVKATAELATNGITAELLHHLTLLEARAFERSGRVDELPAVPPTRAAPVNARTARLVGELKKKL